MRYARTLMGTVLLLFLILRPTPALAQASEPFVGQLIMGAWNFCPKGWAKADAQLLPINQNQALFSLLGTNYGGDGKTTFALPDLRGRVPLNWGSGPGLTPTARPGEMGGEEKHVLTLSEMPMHQHFLNASMGPATQQLATGNLLKAQENKPEFVAPKAGPLTPMHGTAVGPAGSGVPHNVRAPYLTVTTCIAMGGVYPTKP